MKAIVISQEEFDAAFDEFCKSIELANLRERGRDIENLHRIFIYHVRMLQDRLEKK